MVDAKRSAAPLVLVVDDDSYAADLSRRFLETLGCQVALAPDGPSALAAFGADADVIAAVMLDYLMPGMNGDRVYAELRQIRPTLPIIMCSACSPEEVLAHVPAADVLVEFLPKPYTFTQLEAVMRKALPGSPPRGRALDASRQVPRAS